MREIEPVALFRHNSDGTFCVETSVYCTGEPVEVCHFWRVAFVAGRDGNRADTLPWDGSALEVGAGNCWRAGSATVVTDQDPFAIIARPIPKPDGRRGWRWVDGEWRRGKVA